MTIYISKITLCLFAGNGLKLSFSRYHRSRLFGGVFGWIAAALLLSVIDVYCSNLNMLGAILVRLRQGNKLVLEKRLWI